MKAEKAVPATTRQVACQIDLGDGREFDIEYQGDEGLWASTGPGIESVDLWLTAVVADLNLRIRVMRTQSGVEVSVDRGTQNAPWWPAEEVPKLAVAVDPNQGNISVSASVGRGENRREALLGSVPFAKR